jgi:hypothetical protein
MDFSVSGSGSLNGVVAILSFVFLCVLEAIHDAKEKTQESHGSLPLIPCILTSNATIKLMMCCKQAVAPLNHRTSRAIQEIQEFHLLGTLVAAIRSTSEDTSCAPQWESKTRKYGQLNECC